jgi:large subunit ribosomal protein L22
MPEREAKAIAKFLRMSPSKLKPVTDLVRGKDLNEALTILKFTPGKGSTLVEKVVQSAAANAENNHEMNVDALYVAEINANQGPTLKRYRAGAQGRASMIFKRTTHLNVVLREREESKVKVASDTAAKDVETKEEGGSPDGSES